ncbi:hypothetical protein [Pseudomonas syringae]|uniref:hypothetical protein n=1 Tax=Pseudomonas syringae TaxID=317 RepID=UPI003F74BC1A
MASVVCRSCIAEEYLQDALDFEVGDECSFCSSEANVIAFDELVETCETALLASFQYVHQPMSVIHFSREPVGEHLYDVLTRMLGGSDDLITAIGQALLQAWSDWNDDDPYFTEGVSPTSEMSSAWKESPGPHSRTWRKRQHRTPGNRLF